MLNDAIDLYRFFDAKPQIEFLYACAERAIDIDLSHETPAFARCVHVSDEAQIDMPALESLLFSFLDNGNGSGPIEPDPRRSGASPMIRCISSKRATPMRLTENLIQVGGFSIVYLEYGGLGSYAETAEIAGGAEGW